MMAFGLIALIAGAASALMFASIVSGALISLVLVCLAPLPLMLVAIAWGPLCGALGGLAATLVIGVALSTPLALGYGLAIALPAWWLGHLAMLGRPLADGSVDPDPASLQVEWYPLGRVLLWIAALAALLTAGSLFSLGSDASTISDAMRRGFARVLTLMGETNVTENDPRVGLMVAVTPVLVAASQMATLTLNLWLAAKVAAVSGRLHRPWPDLSRTNLPPMTLVALCVALAFSFFGGMTGILAIVVTTVLMVAYALVGLAVLHTITHGLASRAFWLAAAYVIIFMFSVSLVLLTILGLADAVFGFRERFLRNRQPPPLPTS
ncbi:DUF2232 domain-containing protein [Bradyrhizobium guangdongense]|uniref:Membrane protein n=1 Tax=Bradyrhizobium guangdongense TaxID=1325090 RepID=A0A410V637_9BRAD|nr:DUF2232 domain-containing protein [Bradyrhizobium guangdongense]QAU39171.1 hypothetical protein X265_16995 [Bradyrhizobium guangdongense]QOZ60228.1 hypothetical protein XH86_17000 [Bradyrhizobium guangdongense]GGI26942.1 membrane protein [Bradyrhizobium guangdongense]